VPSDRPLRHDVPVWAPFFWVIALFLFHGAAPYGVSLIGTRYGWVAGHPAGWNEIGLLAVAAGLAAIGWLIALHARAARQHGWRMEPTPFEPGQYLIVSGPYRYSRNPIYLAHLTIWGGWTIYYGSIALLVGVVMMWLAQAFIVIPYEERGLIRQLGEPYLRYQRAVGRWFGRRTVAAP
jgi:protein-S-isoprenylcysteine O-methyltransferase Ste14